MRTSFIASDRIFEKRLAQDAGFRAHLKQTGKRTLANGRALADDALLAKLLLLGLKVDHNQLDQWSR
jgi:hypothetical protein